MQVFCKFAVFFANFLQFININVCLNIRSFVQFSKNQGRNKKVAEVKEVSN